MIRFPCNPPADQLRDEPATWPGREQHRLLLSGRSGKVLAKAKELRENDLVCPSAPGRPMSDDTLPKLLRDPGTDPVPHEFRPTLRDW